MQKVCANRIQQFLNALTLSLAIEANLLAPTVKLLQPCQKIRKGKKLSRRKKNAKKVQLRQKIYMMIYRINRRHGVVQEVILFLLWGHCVSKANIAILLIPTVTSSTEEALKMILNNKKH